MSDLGTSFTERQLKITEARLRRVYKEAEKELQKKLDDFVKKFEKRDAQMQADLKAEKITQTDYDTWLRGQVFIRGQWQAKVQQATDVLLDANRQAMNIINHDKMNVFASNANYQAYRFENDSGIAYGFGIYDADTVERLIKEKPELLPRKKVNGRKDKAWNQGIIANSVAQGIIQGDSIPKLAKRIANDTASRDMKAMTRYARTAMTGAQNAGRMETMNRALEMGIKCKKQWLSTLDKRTRDSHRNLDGQVQEVNDPFVCDHGDIMYPGDPDADPSEVYNCRCTLIYVNEDVEYNHVRRSEGGELVENVTYREWEGSLKENGYSYNNTERVQQKKNELETDEAKIESIMMSSHVSRKEAEKIGEALFGYNANPEDCYFDGADGKIRRMEDAVNEKRAKTIQGYIDASPKVQGTIYRGMALTKEQADALTVGTEFDEHKFSISSWSTREDVGQRFANVSQREYGGVRVVFEYADPKHGAPVAHLSPTPIEQEVLVNNKNTRYRIVSKEEYIKERAGSEPRMFTRIVLEETEIK